MGVVVVVMGCDLGQRQDPTALAVVEHDEREYPVESRMIPIGGATLVEEQPPRREMHYVVRHLERLPLMTSYPDVAKRVAKMAGDVQARSGGRTPRLYVDATGVGTPVVDSLKQARVPASIRPVFFNHGDKFTSHDGEYRMGKAFLVSRLQVLLQNRQLHLPETAEARALHSELLDYEIHIDERGSDTYGAFRVGRHDDLCTAVGLAILPVRIARAY